MRAFATRRSPSSFVYLVCAILFGLVAGRANAQVDPRWDHYKVYQVLPNPSVSVAVVLKDQFGTFNHQVETLDWFMNPVQKQVAGVNYPIHDPLLHYTWWRITPQPFSGLVLAQNQFGLQTLAVHDALYLLNPALKNQQGPLPLKNHYKCYACDGQPVNVPVLLTDQFDTWQAVVTYPRWLCNPVDKFIPATGQDYPIVDAKQHYVCYEYQQPDPQPFSAVVNDQFVNNQPLEMRPSLWICVPTDKQGVTSTAPQTWGKLKVLYR